MQVKEYDKNIRPLYIILVTTSITPKLIEQSSKITHRHPHVTGQHTAKMCQDHPKQTLHDDPRNNSKEYLEKAEVKPDAKNSIAINYLATKPVLWRVVYNER